MLGEFPNEFRKCYITDNSLSNSSKSLSISKAEFLKKYIIPDKPNVISGDFGEILSFFAVKENFHSKGIPVNGPLKWLFKNDKNNPVKGACNSFPPI